MAVVLSNWNWDKEATRKNLDNAIKLMPNNRDAYIHYSFHEFRSGNCEKLAMLLKEFKRINPAIEASHNQFNLGFLHCQKEYSKIVSIVKEKQQKSGIKHWGLKTEIVFGAFLKEGEFEQLSEI